MKKAWNKIQRMVKENYRHNRKDFKLGEVTPPFILGQAMAEFKELMDEPDDHVEMADLFGVLIHYCIKQGWTIELIEANLIQKLDLRVQQEMTDLFDSDEPNGATISRSGYYRYDLWRELSSDAGICIFIMLNPSTADASKDDPTIRKCIGFAKRAHCGKLVVLNLFALRATDPKMLKNANDPVGPLNDETILRWTTQTCLTPLIVAGWGTHGSLLEQDRHVIELLKKNGLHAYCFGLTKDQHPRHPLYVGYDTKMELFF